jgi:hypothetical protein
MNGDDNIRHEMADGPNKSHTSLSKSKMYGIVQQGRGVVADKRTEEDE